jgi:hypothetical protein
MTINGGKKRDHLTINRTMLTVLDSYTAAAKLISDTASVSSNKAKCYNQQCMTTFTISL